MSHDSQDDIVSALGILVVNVSLVEESLHDAICILAGGEIAPISVLTAGLSFRTLIEKFGALCAELGTARVPLTEVADFCNHLTRLNEERNTIIHSAWNLRGVRAPSRRFKRTAKVKSGFSLNVAVVTAAQVRDLATRFVSAEQKLWELVP